MCRFCFLSLLCLIAFNSFSQLQFKSSQADTLYSTVVKDPYRALEDTGSAAVKKWMHKEAAQTEAFFASIPGHKKLLKHYADVFKNTKQDYVQSVNYYRGKYYVIKQMPGDDNPTLYEIDKKGKAKLLVNPSTDFPEIKSKNLSINGLTFNPSRPEMFYYLTVGGYEFDPKVVMRNLQNGKQQYDTLYLKMGEAISNFDPDNGSAFYYQRYPNFQNKNLDPNRWFDSATIRYHITGTDPKTDKEIIGIDPSIINHKIDEDVYLWVERGQPFAFAVVKNMVAKEYRIYVAPAATLKSGNIHWKQLTDWDDKIGDWAPTGNWLYLLSNKDAAHARVVRIDLRNPSLATAVDVMPPSDRVLTKLALTKNELLVTALDAGIGKLYRIPHGTTKLDSMKLPVPGNIAITWSDALEPDFIANVTSYVRPITNYTYSAATKRFTPSVVQQYHDGQIAPLVVEEVKVASHDGIEVPMTLVYKKGLVMDGTHPVSFRGYGAYGMQDNPGYYPENMDWFNRGGIWAIAHVRGGGVYGEAWHLAGQKATKPNTWKDFIACGEWLIAHKYATPKTLIATGGSAGGITMGRSVTERPDLFGGMFIAVGALDMIRFETSPNGYGNVPEFGSIKTKEGFNALYEMSAYHHVKDDTPFPPILLTHGVNDNRVPVWNSLKMAARMKEANSSGNPIMLRLNFDSGHGMQTTTSDMVKFAADNMTFYYWRAGFSDFQPVKNSGF